MIHIRDFDENLIIKTSTTELKQEDIKALNECVKKNFEKRVVVNMENVSEVKTTALNELKKVAEQNKLSLCSLEADMHAVINLLKYDKSFCIYPTEESSMQDRYELKTRRFKVV